MTIVSRLCFVLRTSLGKNHTVLPNVKPGPSMKVNASLSFISCSVILRNSVHSLYCFAYLRDILHVMLGKSE